MFRIVSIATSTAPFAGNDSFFSYSTAELIESFAYGDDVVRTLPRDDGPQTTPAHLRLVPVPTSPGPDSGE